MNWIPAFDKKFGYGIVVPKLKVRDGIWTYLIKFSSCAQSCIHVILVTNYSESGLGVIWYQCHLIHDHFCHMLSFHLSFRRYKSFHTRSCSVPHKSFIFDQSNDAHWFIQANSKLLRLSPWLKKVSLKFLHIPRFHHQPFPISRNKRCRSKSSSLNKVVVRRETSQNWSFSTFLLAKVIEGKKTKDGMIICVK